MSTKIRYFKTEASAEAFGRQLTKAGAEGVKPVSHPITQEFFLLIKNKAGEHVAWRV